MTPQEAAALLNGITFRPGWTVTAKYRDWLHHEVDVYVTVDTADTSFPTPHGTYPVPKTLVRRRILRVEPEDDERVVLCRFLDAVHELDWHEDREFLRVRRDGRWVAPFHPHQAEGNGNWSDVQEERAARPTAG